MGQTNIRDGFNILEKAGTARGDTALIPDFQKYVLINGHEFSIDDIQIYSRLLQSGHTGVWNMSGTGLMEWKKVAADQPSQIPMVHVSRALRPRPPVDPSSDSVKLSYFIVVEGRNGRICSKLVERTNLNRLGTDILWECANGYSVVFSGAMLKTDWMQRQNWRQGVRFNHVEKKSDLVETADVEPRVINIWC